jgi:hypothetical protein
LWFPHDYGKVAPVGRVADNLVAKPREVTLIET